MEESAPISLDQESLAQIIMAEVTDTFNLPQKKIITQLINRLIYKPALRFAEILLDIDRSGNADAPWETSNKALQYFTDGCTCEGGENIPKNGPLLVVANHPGAADSVGAFSCVRRKDVKIIAGKRRMLEVLPTISRYILFLDRDINSRTASIRKIIQLLQNGESVIIFPSGLLEPDPSFIPGTLNSIKHWSRSIGIFLNKVPETQVQPLLISHVVAPKAWQNLFVAGTHPIKRRHQLAMIWQFAMQRISRNKDWITNMRIIAGKAQIARNLVPSLDPQELNLAVQSMMIDLLKQTYPAYL